MEFASGKKVCPFFLAGLCSLQNCRLSHGADGGVTTPEGSEDLPAESVFSHLGGVNANLGKLDPQSGVEAGGGGDAGIFDELRLTFPTVFSEARSSPFGGQSAEVATVANGDVKQGQGSGLEKPLRLRRPGRTPKYCCYNCAKVVPFLVRDTHCPYCDSTFVEEEGTARDFVDETAAVPAQNNVCYYCHVCKTTSDELTLSNTCYTCKSGFVEERSRDDPCPDPPGQRQSVSNGTGAAGLGGGRPVDVDAFLGTGTKPKKPQKQFEEPVVDTYAWVPPINTMQAFLKAEDKFKGWGTKNRFLPLEVGAGAAAAPEEPEETDDNFNRVTSKREQRKLKKMERKRSKEAAKTELELEDWETKNLIAQLVDAMEEGIPPSGSRSGGGGGNGMANVGSNALVVEGMEDGKLVELMAVCLYRVQKALMDGAFGVALMTELVSVLRILFKLSESASGWTDAISNVLVMKSLLNLHLGDFDEATKDASGSIAFGNGFNLPHAIRLEAHKAKEMEKLRSLIEGR